MYIIKKSFKIPKGLSESVNRRRTDNTRTKRKNIDLQNITQKSNIEPHQPH
jgi:hypothetical protein